MKLIFKTDTNVAAETALILTHPSEQVLRQKLEAAIQGNDKTVSAINPTNNRTIQIPVRAILVIASEERLCNLRLTTGEQYLYPKRLKHAEADFTPHGFIRINNQTMINIREIAQFASTTNARIEITLSDRSTYLISRHYIKNFRRALS